MLRGGEPRVRFGRIERDAGPQTKFANIRRGDGGPISPELVRPFPPQVEARLEEVQKGELYRVHATISPPWPNGRVRKYLNVKTGVSKGPTERIRLDADVAPRLKAVPKRFMLQPESDQSYQRSVLLVWDKNAPPKTARAEVNDPKLTVRVTEEAGEQKVVLEVPPQFRSASRRLVVTLRTDDKEAPTLTIPVTLPRKKR